MRTASGDAGGDELRARHGEWREGAPFPAPHPRESELVRDHGDRASVIVDVLAVFLELHDLVGDRVDGVEAAAGGDENLPGTSAGSSSAEAGERRLCVCAARCILRVMNAARLVLLTVFLSACPDGGTGAAPKACTKAYDQCTLPTGVLGVCDTVECTEGQPGPCLVCRSQH
jgi:hypothetical protein